MRLACEPLSNRIVFEGADSAPLIFEEILDPIAAIVFPGVRNNIDRRIRKRDSLQRRTCGRCQVKGLDPQAPSLTQCGQGMRRSPCGLKIFSSPAA
jgi:hypothetical protein